jgi:hypothetical protein
VAHGALPLPLFRATYCTRDLPRTCHAARSVPVLDTGKRRHVLHPPAEIAESVFIVSDMVVELVVAGGESRFHFNGTVEWALDSVESNGVVWLPREDQLRETLGNYFLSLDSSVGGFVVTVSGPGKAYHTEAEPDAADAYARAALYVLGANDLPPLRSGVDRA